MKILLLIIGVIITLAGCALFVRGDNYKYTQRVRGRLIKEIPIWVDIKFSEADKGEIDLAISQWNYALNGKIELKIVDEEFDMEPEKILEQIRRNGWLILKINSTDHDLPMVEKGFVCMGFAEKLGGHHIYIVRDAVRRDKYMMGLILHEMGHLLGSGHIGDGLMSPHYTYDGTRCIDYDTIKEVGKWQRIDERELNYCYKEK